MSIGIRLIASLSLLVLALPAGAAPIQILSSERSVTATAYATDDVIQQNETEADSTFTPEPYTNELFADQTLGAITCNGEGRQTSSFSLYAFRAEGAHTGFADAPGPSGFAIAGGSSAFRVAFHLTQASAYTLDGFIEAFDLGIASIVFTGPSGTILNHLISGLNVPVHLASTLQAGDYNLKVETYGEGHGWPPFPSYSSGAYDIHFALAAATDAPLARGRTVLAASPNPFTTMTRIQAPEGAQRIRVLDASGRCVRTLAGSASLVWDGRDERGASTPAGVYFLRADDVTGAKPLKIVRLR